MTQKNRAYTHFDAERACPLCVQVARGLADDDTKARALAHQEEIRSEILSVLSDMAVDGLVDQISNANLAIAIANRKPELMPTQSCISWATGELEKAGQLSKIPNFVPGTRMRRPNGYRLSR